MREKSLCPSCKQPVKIPSRAWNLLLVFNPAFIALKILFAPSKCDACKAPCHRKCLDQILDYDSYLAGRIVNLSLCTDCLDAVSEKIPEPVLCEDCGRNILLGQGAAYCDLCHKIGCRSCFGENAFEINPDLNRIYPYIHKSAKHSYLCPDCKPMLAKLIGEIDRKQQPVVISNEISLKSGSFKLLRNARVQSQESEKEARNLLLNHALQLGGNALINYMEEVEEAEKPTFTCSATVIDLFNNEIQCLPVETPVASINPAETVEVPAEDGNTWLFVCSGDSWLIGPKSCRLTIRHLAGLKQISYLLMQPDREISPIEVHHCHCVDPEKIGKFDDTQFQRGNIPAFRKYDEDTIAFFQEEIEKRQNMINSNSKGMGFHENETVRNEIDTLMEEIKKAKSQMRWERKGKFARDASSSHEKARVNVKKRIATAIGRIRKAEDAAGMEPVISEYLNLTISTGDEVCYRPSVSRKVSWVFRIGD
jgi:hypothetical protein